MQCLFVRVTRLRNHLPGLCVEFDPLLEAGTAERTHQRGLLAQVTLVSRKHAHTIDGHGRASVTSSPTVLPGDEVGIVSPGREPDRRRLAAEVEYSTAASSSVARAYATTRSDGPSRTSYGMRTRSASADNAGGRVWFRRSLTNDWSALSAWSHARSSRRPRWPSSCPAYSNGAPGSVNSAPAAASAASRRSRRCTASRRGSRVQHERRVLREAELRPRVDGLEDGFRHRRRPHLPHREVQRRVEVHVEHPVVEVRDVRDGLIQQKELGVFVFHPIVEFLPERVRDGPRHIASEPVDEFGPLSDGIEQVSATGRSSKSKFAMCSHAKYVSGSVSPPLVPPRLSASGRSRRTRSRGGSAPSGYTQGRHTTEPRKSVCTVVTLLRAGAQLRRDFESSVT